MGSRLNINLAELINNPRVMVTLFSEQQNWLEEAEVGAEVIFDHLAKVEFTVRGKRLEYTYDVSRLKDSALLSCDFNFPRYAVGCIQLDMFRSLYELGICFEITH